MTTIDSMFELAIELRDKGDLKDSVGVLSKILDNYPTYERVDVVHSILGGIYSDLKELKNALNNFKKAIELNPKSELASLGLYVTYANLDRDEEAISELLRFLRQFPAKHYKDTLEGLLEGLENGYMTKYKNDIIELAKLNGIKLPDK
jgi:tetratricopeptide (TPR) repeat protein